MHFSFRTVPKILFGAGLAQSLGEHARGRMQRPIIITDAGVAGLLEGPLASLQAAGLEALVDASIIADPPARIIRGAVETARRHKADGVIGFGGGSPMDAAKLVACLSPSAQRLEDIYGTGNAKGPRLPLILLPTTAGTGSEVTDIAVVTTDDDQKMGVLGDPLFADLAVIDPALTYGLPRPVTAATGVDAMVHAIEAYTNRHQKNPVSDALAREALALLSANILAACERPRDANARAGMALGAMLAGQAFANSPVGAVHGMAYPLGALFHVPHGLSNALMLAPVLRFTAPACAPLYGELGAVIGAPGGADAFIARLDALITQTGLPRRLSQVGVSHDDLPRMAQDAMKAERVMRNNPRPVGYDDALALYKEVL